MVYYMNKPLYYIHRDKVYQYRHSGGTELFETEAEAWAAIETRKASRIIELKRELAALEAGA